MPPPDERPLAQQTMLVVEDEALIALDLQTLLTAAGAHVLVALSPEEAAKLLETVEVSAAVVDVHLGLEVSGNICELLWQRHIPFVFYTSDPTHPMGDVWPDVQVLAKPATADEVIAALTAVSPGSS